ncbi:hypothetical protein ACXX9E_29490 [Pseudomonas sp. GNP014]
MGAFINQASEVFFASSTIAGWTDWRVRRASPSTIGKHGVAAPPSSKLIGHVDLNRVIFVACVLGAIARLFLHQHLQLLG